MSNLTEETKIAVLETLVAGMTKEISRLVIKVDALNDSINNHYVKKEDFIAVRAEVEKLRYWQAKVIGISLSAAFTINYLPGVLHTIVTNISSR